MFHMVTLSSHPWSGVCFIEGVGSLPEDSRGRMMRPTLKKLEVKDIGALERLVAENVEGIELGLTVIDGHLLLGQAAIDLVGLDAKGSLVLIALDFTADEGLLLRGMDAYSWCLEYPDTIGRLYPAAEISPARPPLILFNV